MDFLSKSREEVISWLEARLKGEDSWNSRHLASYLQKDLLGHVISSYPSLEQHARVKILLAMLETSGPVLERERDQFSGLLSLARQDDDEWVSRLGVLVEHFLFQTLPAAEIGSLLEGAETIAKKLRSKDLARYPSPCQSLLPPDLAYLNYSVLTAQALSPASYGSASSAGRGHFRLKRKLRTSAIKDHILTKSKDTQKLEEDSHPHPSHPLPSSGKSGDIFIPPNSRDKPHSHRASKPPASALYHQKGHFPQSRSSTTKLLHMEDLAPSGPVAPLIKRKRKEFPPSQLTPLKGTPENDKLKRKKSSLSRYSPPLPQNPHTKPPETPGGADQHSSTDSHSPVPPLHTPKPSHKRSQKIQEKKHRFMEDMFAEADLLSEKQKQIIMDFMVGQATKPNSEPGDKITFTLNKTIHENDSEKTEVETLFEMDYSTKQWRKLKKSVVLKMPT